MSQGKYVRLQSQAMAEEAEIKRLARLVNSAHSKGWIGRVEKYSTQLATAKESLRKTHEQMEGIEAAAEMWAGEMIETVGLRNEPNSDAHKAWGHLRDAALALPELTELGAPKY
jgi:hypothetical protein